MSGKRAVQTSMLTVLVGALGWRVYSLNKDVAHLHDAIREESKALDTTHARTGS